MNESASLLMDGQTLINLEVLRNTVDGSAEGTLHALLNQAVSPFGKRLFQRWLCHPLRHVPAINARLDAIDDMRRLPALLGARTHARTPQWRLPRRAAGPSKPNRAEAGEGVAWEARCRIAGALRKRLSVLPDLERILSRVHAASCKLPDFLSALGGFRAGQALIKMLASHGSDLRSARLQALVAEFPDVASQLDHFDSLVDHTTAQSEGTATPSNGGTTRACVGVGARTVGRLNAARGLTDDVRSPTRDGEGREPGYILPKRGSVAEYDAVQARVVDIVRRRDAHVDEMKKRLKCVGQPTAAAQCAGGSRPGWEHRWPTSRGCGWGARCSTRELTIKDVGGDVFQLEVPKSVNVPSSFMPMSSTSVGERGERRPRFTLRARLTCSWLLLRPRTHRSPRPWRQAVKRYWTPTLKDLALEWAEAQETRTRTVSCRRASHALPPRTQRQRLTGARTLAPRARGRWDGRRRSPVILQGLLVTTLQRFCDNYDQWARCEAGVALAVACVHTPHGPSDLARPHRHSSHGRSPGPRPTQSAVNVLAELDCLLALAEVAHRMGGMAPRPVDRSRPSARRGSFPPSQARSCHRPRHCRRRLPASFRRRPPSVPASPPVAVRTATAAV